MHKNILIGITGNIASGKSYVMQYLRSKGYKTFDADQVVHELYRRPEVQRQVLLMLELESLDKARIAEIIFKNEEKKLELENLIHPLVIEELKIFAQSLPDAEPGFAEIPLMFEAKMENLFDYIILVYCDKNIRLQRAIARGSSEDKFLKRDKAQMQDEIKKHLVDFVIDSNADRDTFYPQIDEIIKKIGR